MLPLLCIIIRYLYIVLCERWPSFESLVMSSVESFVLSFVERYVPLLMFFTLFFKCDTSSESPIILVSNYYNMRVVKMVH